MLIDALKAKQYRNTYKTKKKVKDVKSDADINKTLKGVLINKNVKNSTDNGFVSFDEIGDTLLICDTPNYYSIPKEQKKDETESAFNLKKTMTPLVLGTGAMCASIFAISAILKKSSKTILNTKSFEQLPDLAVNMNIKEEPQFALYRAIRDPNTKNLLGALGVFVMSGITIISKNFVEGAKEIWLKKKAADVEKDLQEQLIDVETNSFSGKLNVVNELLNSNVKYFDSVLNSKKEEQTSTPSVFAGFMSFKGSEIAASETTENKTSENKEKSEKAKNKKELYKNIGFAALTAGVVAGAIALGKMSLTNIRKTAQNSNKFANDVTEATIDVVKNISDKGNSADLPSIIGYLKAISAKPEFIEEIGKKYNLADGEIQSIIEQVNETTKTIFADAPVALGGIPKKIQYYCYIDENRGHLYNWILNPENKFTKYIFTAFTITGSLGYLFKQGMDALKELAVLKENAKTELDLRKRLVDVEIRNFKAKKESAINPLVDNFNKQVQSGNKSQEELKQIADNILMETKNGPPYVYT